MTYDHSALVALADPTRRTLFELIAAGPRSVAALTRELPVSQSAVSQHLKVLRDARLVTSEPIGTRNIYRIDPAGIGQMRAWLDRMWDAALSAFKTEVEREDKR